MLITPTPNRASLIDVPLTLPGLSLWIDPSDMFTLFQDGGGSTPTTASGQSVGMIRDKSGNGRHLVQATAGNRPLFGESGGKRFLDFVSSDTLAYVGATPVATAIVGAYMGSGSNSNAGLVTNTNNTDSGPRYIWTRRESTTDWTSDGSALAGSGRMWRDGAQTVSFVANGSAVYSADSTGVTPPTSLGSGVLLGQDRGLSGRYLVGRIYGLILCSGILSDGDRARAEAWMMAKI